MREPKNIVWGTFLVVVGVLLLLERLIGLHGPRYGAWPLVFFALAASSAVERKVGAVILNFALGVIFLCVSMGWFGLSYHTAWPLLMVAAGLAMVFKSITDRPRVQDAAQDISEVTHE